MLVNVACCLARLELANVADCLARVKLTNVIDCLAGSEGINYEKKVRAIK